MAAAMSTLGKWLDPVSKRATAEAWGLIRHDLWSWANASPAFQRGMAARSKAKRAAAKSVPESAARMRVQGKPAYVVTIGAVPVSDTQHTSQDAAEAFARAFSREHPGITVDVRTAISRDKLSHYREGKRVHRNSGRPA